MIIVTGGAGFIGSNIVKGLNERGRSDILVVDNLTNMVKFKNIQALKIADYMNKYAFAAALKEGKFDQEKIDVIFHEGACSDTMEYNGKYMMENNFEYTKNLLHFSLEREIQFIYASSASTYGSGAHGFREEHECEEALNVYAFSKLFFDNYLRRFLPDIKSQVVGLRYFNVYGPQENHKGKMASMVFQMYNQWKAEKKVKLFDAYGGYGAGEQTRDFIYVKDVVKVNFYFWEHPEIKGIYNCGTGHAHQFNALAKGVLKHFGSGDLEYIPFPEVLKGKYQSFTEADPKNLLAAGYDGGFTDIEEAVEEYCKVLDKTGGYYIYEG
ncbi:MAG: ADP-glyceromanno-heptose 6-epimerase [Phascolarctobacterium sp.]|nr:ADP-glyceromanno-heptose 6-epimerase [Phascolarctobacterium sp.]